MLVVLCGGHDLHVFLERTARNSVYTSHVAIAEFIEALGTWIEESLLKRLRQASCFSIMADECTDIGYLVGDVGVLSLGGRWRTRRAFC